MKVKTKLVFTFVFVLILLVILGLFDYGDCVYYEYVNVRTFFKCLK